MNPSAKIYMQEAAVLEEAREQMERELEDLWGRVWEEAKPQLDVLANSNDRVVQLRVVKATRGRYILMARPKDSRMTRERADPRLSFWTRDCQRHQPTMKFVSGSP